MVHVSVLLAESVQALRVRKGSKIIDGTINGGGHSALIVSQMEGEGLLLGIDLDSDALARARKRLGETGVSIHLCEGNYAQMEEFAGTIGCSSFDGILLDLGLSSNQLEDSGRGFSFQKNEPLSMSFRSVEHPHEFTARDIVNEWEESTIANILFGYAEEKFARRIAKGIIDARHMRPILTTQDLVEVVKRSTPFWYHHGRSHPATRTFQALRIAVNDEMESLNKGLASAQKLLTPGGRLAVITFHSIEDRIVKTAFVEAERNGKGTVITRKPITPGDEELAQNPRARSAKLRIFEAT